MVIDFHVHAFADKIAERAIGELRKNLREGGLDDAAYSDGTYSDTEAYFCRAGSGDGSGAGNRENYCAVFMPIATKPSQMTICNNIAAGKNNYSVGGSKFWSFGSVFPKTSNPEELDAVLAELSRIKSLGLYGIKLHPDYQLFYPDDENVFPVYEKCAELGLPIMFHAGFDPISPKLTHATPDRLLRVIECFPNLVAIFAHMGGEDHWDEVYDLLCGKNCFIDTSYCAENMDSALMEKMIKKHGSERVLFGSDFPWKTPEIIVTKLLTLGLTEDDISNILYKNALKLINQGT
ncbi:MAG: amidohydrolase family protein [Ruminococcus sp.]|nr:amidohydrolase family protein [Ruminococcus sp.]